MAVTQEKYSQQRLTQLEDHLIWYAESGEPLEYDIMVDGIPAVRRTNNTDMFTAYENFISGNSNLVQVNIYKGKSRNCDRFIFFFREPPTEAPAPAKKNNTLNGIEDLNQHIQDAVSKERERWNYDLLRKEKQQLEHEVEFLEGELNRMEKEISDLKAGQSPLKGVLGEVGSVVVESLVRRNAHLLNAIPGGSALAGIIESDNRRIEQNSLPEPEKDGEVSFSIKQPSANEHTYSEEDLRAISFVSSLKARFTPEEFGRVIEILNACALDTSLIEDILDLLTPSNNSTQSQETKDYDETHF